MDPIPRSGNTTRLGFQKRRSVPRHGAWNLTMSFCRPGCSCLREFLRPTRPVAHRFAWPGSQRLNLTGPLPCAVNLAHSGDHYPSVGSVPGASWVLTQTLPLTGNLNRILKPNQTIDPRCLLVPYFIPLGRSRDWSCFGPGNVLDPTLTLAQTLSQWGCKQQTINRL